MTCRLCLILSNPAGQWRTDRMRSDFIPNRRLTHLSLFSGIGGIDLAAERAGFETVGQCEFADYPTKVLEKHWPDVPRWRDVRDVTVKSFRERTGIEKPTLLSGGFPCQPHSFAGKRLASYDERDLWGEFARIIREIKPRWIVGENVPGLLSSEGGRFFGRILRDLAKMGYNVGWCCFPAAWVGAIHRRERVFIIAHTQSKRRDGGGTFQQKRPANLFAQAVSAEIQQDTADYILPALQWRDLEPVRGILRNDDGRAAGVDRLTCLGNAVVPHQVYPILEMIYEIEQG